MTASPDRETAAREKTLLASLLLSSWGPPATGLGVILGRSTTQLADFIRRTVELAALFVSWAVFRRLAREGEAAGPSVARLERLAGLGVAGALVVSGMIMAAVAAVRMGSFLPGGNVYPGLVVGVLGVVTNTWFWRRYTAFSRQKPNPIMTAQAYLYRAKAFVDLGVILALGAVAAAPEHPATRYVDVLGSAVVAAYLIWSGARTARGLLIDRSPTDGGAGPRTETAVAPAGHPPSPAKSRSAESRDGGPRRRGRL